VELAAAALVSFISPRMNLHLQLLVHMLAGWINRHQQSVIEYLQAENRALREQLGPKRIRWTHEQRRRLAEKAKAVATPSSSSGPSRRPTRCFDRTDSSWPPGCDGSAKRGPGCPRVKQSITELVVEMARSNPGCEAPHTVVWGYKRIRGALHKHRVDAPRFPGDRVIAPYGLKAHVRLV